MLYLSRLSTHRNNLQRAILWTVYGVCLSLFAVIVGCSPSTSTVELSPTTRAEVDGILNTLQARYLLTDSLKITQMAVTIEEGEQREEVRESLWYKKSESGGELLLIQALGPINEPRAVVIANRDENQFVLALLNEERTYHGPLSDGALKRDFWCRPARVRCPECHLRQSVS